MPTTKNQSTQIVWETPDPDGRTSARADWQAIAELLRAKPHEWALLREGTLGSTGANAKNIRSGQIASFRPAGSFEAVTRKSDEGAKLYARFVGES